MGARAFELEPVVDETAILTGGCVAVDHTDFPLAKQVPYAQFRRPTRTTEAVKNTGFGPGPNDNGTIFICTAALTVTLPLAAVLGIGWRCQVYADGAAVVVTRTGGATVNLVSGELLDVRTANNKLLAFKTATPTIV